jgi:hypothetical protein
MLTTTTTTTTTTTNVLHQFPVITLATLSNLFLMGIFFKENMF